MKRDVTVISLRQFESAGGLADGIFNRGTKGTMAKTALITIKCSAY